MPIIHFMGLGRSPGAIIAPVSYINTRLNRNNETDQSFFAGSGGRRQHHDLPGMIEVIVFRTLFPKGVWKQKKSLKSGFIRLNILKHPFSPNSPNWE